MGEYTIELIRRVYNDATGEHIQVKSDSDALGLVELTCSESEDRLVFTTEEARLVAAALIACAAELDVKP